MYMGKNYTLYINVDRFAQEDNKSGLVNGLLYKHYGGTPALDEDKVAHKDNQQELIKAKLRKTVDAMQVCKNGHLYKGVKCTQKGCNG
jgi:hypothetical protein